MSSVNRLFFDPWLQTIVDFWTSRFRRALSCGSSCSSGFASLEIEKIGHGWYAMDEWDELLGKDALSRLRVGKSRLNQRLKEKRKGREGKERPAGLGVIGSRKSSTCDMRQTLVV